MPPEPGSTGTPQPAITNGASGAKSDKPTDSSPLQLLGRWMRHAMAQKTESSLEEALTEVLDEHHEEEGITTSNEERNLLRNMIAFGALKVGDVMIPRTDISAVPASITQDELVKHIAEQRHTRIPVYEDSLDNVKGFLHIKDVFFCLTGAAEFDIQALRRDVLFVPASMRIVDLLVKMRLSSCHMAIVVDEYGGTDGIVTMEDLFEEIVGEIQDEHDEDEVQPEMRWVSDKALEADARVKIDALMQELQFDLVNGHGNDDFDTLGGLIFAHLGRIPAKGEVINYGHGIKLEILSADPRSIKKVRVVRMEPVAKLVEA